MGHSSYDIGDAESNHLSDPGWDAPRLSQALLDAAVHFWPYQTALERAIAGRGADIKRERVSLTDATAFDDDLKALLGHIQERLEGGLEEAWLSSEGYGSAVDLPNLLKMLASPAAANAGKDLCTNALAMLANFHTDDEKWARAFSELFVFSAYAGPDMAYYNNQTAMTTFVENFRSVYPIVVACQQLSTFGILSRGVTAADVTLGGTVGCGCTGSTVALRAFDRAKSKPPVKPRPINEDPTFDVDQRTAPPFADTHVLMETHHVTPGSVLVFNPGGPTAESQNLGTLTHIGTMLRVSGTRIQFIDTGVVTKDAQGESGTADHSFIDGPLRPDIGKFCVGVGVIDGARENVPDAISKLQAARPLGVVRLAIIDSSSGSDRVRFVSKLLHMRYAVSRLIWSLRWLPVEDNLRVVWMVYAVHGKNWADKLMNADIDIMAPAELLTLPVTGAGNPQAQSDVAVNPTLYPANFIRSEPKGGVTVARWKESNDPRKSGYAENFGSVQQGDQRKPNALMGQRLKIALSAVTQFEKNHFYGLATPLGTWAEWPETFGDRYIDATPGNMARTPALLHDTGNTGVAFFDPPANATKPPGKAPMPIPEDAIG